MTEVVDVLNTRLAAVSGDEKARKLYLGLGQPVKVLPHVSVSFELEEDESSFDRRMVTHTAQFRMVTGKQYPHRAAEAMDALFSAFHEVSLTLGASHTLFIRQTDRSGPDLTDEDHYEGVQTFLVSIDEKD